MDSFQSTVYSYALDADTYNVNQTYNLLGSKSGSTISALTASTATSGAQAVFAVQAGDTAQMYKMSPNDSLDMTFDTQSWYGQLLARNLTASVSLNDETDAFVINRIECTLTLTNMSNLSYTVNLYDVVCINDCTRYMPYGHSPLAHWHRGLGNANTTTSGNPYSTAQYPRTTPTQSALFNQYWKILKTHTLTMDPGATHEHKFVSYLNRPVYPFRLSSVKGSIEGITRATVCSCLAQPVEATSTGNVGKITPGIVDLNTTFTYKAVLGRFIGNRSIFAGNTQNYAALTQSNGQFKASVDSSRIFTGVTDGDGNTSTTT